MRVIAGRLGGRTFNAPPGNRTHPMSEKLRGALFNTLGDIGGLVILDAFAGSGALAFEAISRGAASATAIEVDKKAYQTIITSLQALTLQDKVRAVRANVSGWSDNNPGSKFDIVVADPPYDKLNVAKIQKLVMHVADGGIFVLSWPGNIIVPQLVGLRKSKTQKHGDAQLIYYKSI